MFSLKRTAGLHFEKSIDNIDDRTKAVIVSLGGMAASSSRTRDDIQELSHRIEANVPNGTVFTFWGEGHTITRSKVIGENILNVAKAIRREAKVNPKIVFVGKSMGAHKLWRASKYLHEQGVDLDLFVGLEVSGWPDRHHEEFIESEGEEGAHWFYPNVKSLYGFYQTKAHEKQTGSPILYRSSRDKTFFSVPSECDSAYNIQVYKTPFNQDTLTPDPDAQPITSNIVGHLTVDSDRNVISTIEKLVMRTLSEVL